MKASDIMVTDVISVSPDSNVQDVARILLTNRISAVPVVDGSGKLVGIVSEGDLLRRAESGTEHDRAWWLKLLMGREILAAEYVKECSRKVADVMTREIISAEPDTPVADIATLLERHRIKRVPIVRNGEVVGIVSRANLIQALATFRKKAILPQPVADAELRERVVLRLKSEPRGAAEPGQCDRHRGHRRPLGQRRLFRGEKSAPRSGRNHAGGEGRQRQHLRVPDGVGRVEAAVSQAVPDASSYRTGS
jgi:CBS domain-containing protein